VEVQEVQVVEDKVDQLVQVAHLQHTQLKVNLALPILVVVVELEDQTVVLTLEQELVVQEQLSLDSQDLLDQEYL
jgi:hypothetical protein